MKDVLKLEIFEYPSYKRLENIKFFNRNEDEKLIDLFAGSLCDVDEGYSFIDNFLKLSNRNPNVLFVITSYSYVSDRTFVLNGRFYTTRAKIVFNEFDIGKLN